MTHPKAGEAVPTEVYFLADVYLLIEALTVAQ